MSAEGVDLDRWSDHPAKAVPKRPGDVQVQIQEQAAIIEGLEKMVAELTERLHPVTRQEPEAPGAALLEAPLGDVPVANDLAAANQRLRQLDARLGGLIEKLGI